MWDRIGVRVVSSRECVLLWVTAGQTSDLGALCEWGFVFSHDCLHCLQ